MESKTSRAELPRPFLKWAGGKGQIIARLLARAPEDFKAYHEPFLGAGALFFALRRKGLLEGKGVFLSDNNPELVNAFSVVRDRLEALLETLKGYADKNNPEDYYRIRAEAPQDPVSQAARLIYLNRTCYNGLYRVNSRGQFNVPFGHYRNPRIYDPENLTAASRALQGAEITCEDFEGVLARAKPGDFVYFDPPYYPVSATARFSNYTRDGFSEGDHRRLARVFSELAQKGAYVMESNSDTAFVRELYSPWQMERVMARRPINSKGDRRGPVGELIITTY